MSTIRKDYRRAVFHSYGWSFAEHLGKLSAGELQEVAQCYREDADVLRPEALRTGECSAMAFALGALAHLIDEELQSRLDESTSGTMPFIDDSDLSALSDALLAELLEHAQLVCFPRPGSDHVERCLAAMALASMVRALVRRELMARVKARAGEVLS
jgi:hypothetical protein